MSSSEVADALAHVCERVETPIIVDADTGYGNALNVERTVRLFERAGAAAIQLEDQTFPKRCGHLEGKGIVPMHEMVGKIHAAADARRQAQRLCHVNSSWPRGVRTTRFEFMRLSQLAKYGQLMP